MHAYIPDGFYQTPQSALYLPEKETEYKLKNQQKSFISLG